MKNFKSNFLLRGEDYIIVEADEFDKSFLKLSPDFACITSIDPDHLDIYRNKESYVVLSELKKCFAPHGLDTVFLTHFWISCCQMIFLFLTTSGL